MAEQNGCQSLSNDRALAYRDCHRKEEGTPKVCPQKLPPHRPAAQARVGHAHQAENEELRSKPRQREQKSG